jgi:uncharacterized SAM-binding protein YcdF (DUF218 family)
VRLRYWIILAILLVAGLSLEEVVTYRAVRRQATQDEARPAAAIAVFGAAEYNGRASPVFKARLDHALDLEERGLAPLVITTGGRGGDPHFTEGGVGRDYLIQQGVAAARILEDSKSDSTFESAEAVARMLGARGKHTCIAVSDGFHLYRIKLMLESLGVTTYTSPAPASPIEADPFDRTMYSLREMLLVTLWHVGIKS